MSNQKGQHYFEVDYKFQKQYNNYMNKLTIAVIAVLTTGCASYAKDKPVMKSKVLKVI